MVCSFGSPSPLNHKRLGLQIDRGVQSSQKRHLRYCSQEINSYPMKMTRSFPIERFQCASPIDLSVKLR